MTDFILSGRDRHLSNVSILRDADSLKFIKLAPIYDSGKSMFVDASVSVSEKDMLKITTESFMSTELKLLSLVHDKTLVDTSKLPSLSFIKELYLLDENMDDCQINDILRGYEIKIDLFNRWQKGEDLNKIIVGKYQRTRSSALSDIFA